MLLMNYLARLAINYGSYHRYKRDSAVLQLLTWSRVPQFCFENSLIKRLIIFFKLYQSNR